MAASSKFFSNKNCEYYPCHNCDTDINCLFCYCPLYTFDCPGDYHMVEKNGKIIKSCINCTFPHKPENFDMVISILRNN